MAPMTPMSHLDGGLVGASPVSTASWTGSVGAVGSVPPSVEAATPSVVTVPLGSVAFSASASTAAASVEAATPSSGLSAAGRGVAGHGGSSSGALGGTAPSCPTRGAPRSLRPGVRGRPCRDGWNGGGVEGVAPSGRALESKGSAVKVDVWSDVVCPWCFIGLANLDVALEELGEDVDVELHSFQLDPRAVTRTAEEHLGDLARKYGTTVDEVRARQGHLERMGAERGIDFRFDRSVTGNTHDAHRLLHLARERGVQRELKTRLGRAYFTDGDPIARARHAAQGRRRRGARPRRGRLGAGRRRLRRHGRGRRGAGARPRRDRGAVLRDRRPLRPGRRPPTRGSAAGPAPGAATRGSAGSMPTLARTARSAAPTAARSDATRARRRPNRGTPRSSRPAATGPRPRRLAEVTPPGRPEPTARTIRHT